MTLDQMIEALTAIRDEHEHGGRLWVEDGCGSLITSADVRVTINDDGEAVVTVGE